MSELANKFGIPQSLFDVAKKTIDESTEYQNKVKAHMAKKGIKSLGDLSPEEKKKFFNDLDAAHKAKNEEVEAVDEAEYKDLSHARNMYHKHLVAASRAVTGSAEQKHHYDKLNKYKKILGLGIGAMDYEKLKKIMKKEEVEDEEVEGVAEGKKPDRYHIVGKDGKPANLASYADKASAIKDRDEKHPGAVVQQVGPRGKVKDVSEGSLEKVEEVHVKGKGYDNPDNDRKAPEGKVPMTSLMPGHNDKAARLAAVQAKGKLVKGKAQSAPQKEGYELTQEDVDFINSLNERK